MLCSYRTPCVTSLNSLNSIERLRQLLIVQTMERTQIKMMELLLWPHFKKVSPFIIAEYLSIFCHYACGSPFLIPLTMVSCETGPSSHSKSSERRKEATN